MCIASNEERENANILGSLIEKRQIEIAAISPSLILSLPIEKYLKLLVLGGEKPTLQTYSSFCDT